MLHEKSRYEAWSCLEPRHCGFRHIYFHSYETAALPLQLPSLNVQAPRICWVSGGMGLLQDSQPILSSLLLPLQSPQSPTRQRFAPCLHPSGATTLCLAGSHHKLRGFKHSPHPTERKSQLSVSRDEPPLTQRSHGRTEKGDLQICLFICLPTS